MRRIDHRSFVVPDILNSKEAMAALAELETFLSLPAADVASRRAPMNERIYLGESVRNALRGLPFDKCAYCETAIPSASTFARALRLWL